MSSQTINRCVRGASLAPLTNEQKTRLVLLARDAWLTTKPADTNDKAAFDGWRHQQCLMCCERPGLTALRQEDFLHAEAHWLRMLGKGAAADRRELRAAVEPRIMALHKLRAECQAARDVIESPMQYVACIAASKFKTKLVETDLSAKQIWTLVFDIRRAAQKRRARQPGVPF